MLGAGRKGRWRSKLGVGLGILGGKESLPIPISIQSIQSIQSTPIPRKIGRIGNLCPLGHHERCPDPDGEIPELGWWTRY